MTGYHISIGYNGANGTDPADAWEILKAATRAVCNDPAAIIQEARRLGAPETCNDGCCDLETYADNYLEEFGTDGHPIHICESQDPSESQIMQWASTDSPIKYHVRRAFVRLLIKAMHKRGIEVNLNVS